VNCWFSRLVGDRAIARTSLVDFRGKIADQIVIGIERFRGNPANLSFSCKAAEMA
jgi:hypothetical protein